MKTQWCIALENTGPYTDPVLGVRYKFLKGERATKEKVFNMIPDMTEEEYAKSFRPATEEEINGEFEWNGLQYILKKPKCMTIEEKAKRYDEIVKVADKYRDTHIMFSQIEDEMFPELAESKDERIRKHLIGVVELYYGNTDEQEKKDCLAWLEKQQKPEVDQHSLPVSDNSSLPTFNEDMYHPCTEKSYDWSEEDEKCIKDLLHYLEHYSILTSEREKCINWLKSLKDRYTWKPSDEQMEYLAKAIAPDQFKDELTAKEKMLASFTTEELETELKRRVKL